MSLRREFLSYVGTGAIGGIIGYYAGAKELLGLQSSSVDTATSPPTETPTPTARKANSSETPRRAGPVFYDFEDADLSDWQMRGHDSENEMGIANTGQDSQHSLYLDHNGSINNFWVESSLGSVVSPTEISFWIQPTGSDQYSKDMFRFRNGETDVIWFTNHRQNDGVYFRFGDGNDEEDRERVRDGAITPDVGRFVKIRLAEIDWEGGDIGVVYIDGEQVATGAPFLNTQPGFDAVAPYSVGGGASAFRVDNIGWQ